MVVVMAAALAAMVLAVVMDFMIVVIEFEFVDSFVVVSHFSVQKHQRFFPSIRCMSVYVIG